MSESKQITAGGTLLELPRDQAKAFFGCRDEASVGDFLRMHLSLETTNRVSFSSADWQLLARVFGDGSLDVGSGEPPLGWCFLAGRPMPAADGTVVNLLRPDMVGHIATRLAEVATDGTSEWFAARVKELGLEAADDQVATAASHVNEIQTFCDAAAKQGSAVVFAAT